MTENSATQITEINITTGEISARDMSATEIADLLMARPSIAQLSREAFCVALIDAGIFTQAEATDAALGAWPPKFEPALAGKDLVEVLTIKNLWREAKTVVRDAPLFLDLLEFYAKSMSLTAEKASELGDAIFANQVVIDKA